MNNFDFVLILLGAIILLTGFYYALRIIRILREEQLARPWIILGGMIVFFFFGYIFMVLNRAGIGFFKNINADSVVAYVFFFGSIFVLVTAYLNKNLLTSIFGLEMSDKDAVEKFVNHMQLNQEQINRNLIRKFSVTCDNCEKSVTYSIPDIVRMHPQLDRGVVLKRGMGTENFVFYVRHHCKDSYREIPVMHDRTLEYRSLSKSRLV